MKQAALLRGVNLGKRQVKMAELRAVLESAGYGDVRTLIASGNVVLDAKQKAAALEAALEQHILEGLGLKTDVFVRTGAELDALIAANPFKRFAQQQPSFLVVQFMRAKASKTELEAIAASTTTGEDAVQGKNCLYIKFPKGQGPSKLKSPKLATARNWNTVLKLAAAVRAA